MADRAPLDVDGEGTLFPEKVNVYSVPPCSYYVVPDERNRVDEELLHLSTDLIQQHFDKMNSKEKKKTGADAAYVPRGEVQDRPREYLGRRLEQQRYIPMPNTPYRIPLWDQACLKYIFADMFDGTIDCGEFYSLAKMVLMVAINCVTVAINVFFSDDKNSLAWVKVTSKVVFIIELVVVYSLFIFLLIVIAEAVIYNNISTNLASDVAALTNRISTFSAFRVVAIVSPAFAIDNILSMIPRALNLWDYVKASLLLILWLCACVLGGAAVILKVTQISFTSTKSITEWSIEEFVQLIGLTLNLARVNDSYVTETGVLLDAIHRHFSTPGIPKDGLGRRECLYTRLMNALKIPHNIKLEYFDVIFDYHFNLSLQNEKLSTTAKIRKALNYMAFILRMDNAVLRCYLQMTQSPLPFYQMGRTTFMTSFREGDNLGMDIALWHSDPLSSSTQRYALMHKDQFNITFECEECREIWDSANLGEINENAAPEMNFRKALAATCTTPASS